jgi:hypothetical protein
MKLKATVFIVDSSANLRKSAFHDTLMRTRRGSERLASSRASVTLFEGLSDRRVHEQEPSQPRDAQNGLIVVVGCLVSTTR